MVLFPERVNCWEPGTVQTWGPDDCSLYALAVGADFEDHSFVLSGDKVAKLKVYPTFLLALVSADANSRVDPLLGIGEFDASTPVVLGEQRLVLHREVEATGSVAISMGITGLYDKGSGAVVVIEARGVDPDGGADAFTATMTMFVVGAGNFGGERGPGRDRIEWPSREPDWTSTFVTPATQSLLYMHAGNDDNAIHVDAAAARAAGFDGPILTGQNSLGVACRAIVHEVCEDRAEEIQSITGGFGKPAYNGDTLTTEIWSDGSDDEEATRRLIFRVVNQDKAILIDGGRCQLAGPQ
jgi:acyl dehydratase